MKKLVNIEINGKLCPSTIEVPDEPIVDERPYKDRVVARIRERYSLEDELGILRQRDTKPQEFEEYFAFVEQIKLEERDK